MSSGRGQPRRRQPRRATGGQEAWDVVQSTSRDQRPATTQADAPQEVPQPGVRQVLDSNLENLDEITGAPRVANAAENVLATEADPSQARRLSSSVTGWETVSKRPAGPISRKRRLALEAAEKKAKIRLLAVEERKNCDPAG